MLNVRVEGDRVHIGEHFFLSFMRTLRIPDDGREYPLPPALGTLPIQRVADFADRVPAEWRERGGIFIPLYQREALWLSFRGQDWHPVAVQVAVGQVDALTGDRWQPRLSAKPQNYVVAPLQPWLDGINSGAGTVRQFVAMPLGQGYTVEGQVTGQEVFGGLQLRVYDAKPGRFPDEDPNPPAFGRVSMFGSAPESPAMGLGAGGVMRQAIYPDPHGVATWDEKNYGELVVHIVNSERYREITGQETPPTPVDAAAYTANGYPWFDLYDEALGDISPSGALGKVKSVREVDAAIGLPQQGGDASIDVPTGQIRTLDKRANTQAGNKRKRLHWWERLLRRSK